MTVRDVLQLVMPIAMFGGVFGFVWTLRPQVIANHPRRWSFIFWTLVVAGALALVATIGQIVYLSVDRSSP